jgi:endonuclease G, mitochondrial
LPKLTTLGKSVAAKLEDGSTELKYHKFSVVVHKGRRLALFTASNVDWRPDTHKVNGKKPTRKELTGLPDKTAEQWVTDWRIAEDEQLPDIFFSEDDGAFDKGHLVRRDDVAWGSSFEDIQKGNGDTYHTTNCSPQIKDFNQASQGEDNWGDLENLVQKETKAEKACIFAGPVLEEDDPQFRGTMSEDGTKVLIRIPRSFWKIIVVNDGDLKAYGFVLEQDLANVPLEFAVPTPWKKFMKSIDDIEALLNGLADLKHLKPFDQFDSNEAVRINEAIGGGGMYRIAKKN